MLELRSIVDRYRIDAHLSQGSAADVYQVTHVWLYERMVLKHLRADAPPELRHILLEEGRIQCGRIHQNIVAVHDALVIDDRPALVMEFVDGPDLADWLDARQSPPIPEALDLFRGVLRGVMEAHRQGLVHRDLKPENVFLARQHDDTLVPKIADFGMAKRLEQKNRRNTLSSNFSLIGTPEYMAPEQIRDASHVDYRSDIFSLGVILYELTTGRLPFEHDDVMQVLALVLAGTYVAPREIRPEISEPMANLIGSMLALDPQDRPRSTEEIHEMLSGL